MLLSGKVGSVHIFKSKPVALTAKSIRWIEVRPLKDWILKNNILGNLLIFLFSKNTYMLALTTSFLRRTLSVVGVRAQAKLLLGRLEVIGPGSVAAAGRRNYALNLERIWANQRRADQLSRLQGKAVVRRGHFKID